MPETTRRSFTGQPLGRDEVVAAFEDTPDLEMCDICRPWGSLGVDKPMRGVRIVGDPDEPA